MAADTKERILDSAERLFGERGFPGTSLRDITAEAGVNLASVNYHFGSKEALLSAVLERRLQPINTARLERLEQVLAAARHAPPRLEDVVRAFLAPPFEMGGACGGAFLRLVGRVHGETNEEFRATFMKQFDEVFSRFADVLRRALPQVDSVDLSWRMVFMVGSMAFTMSWGELMVSRTPGVARAPDDVLESLIAYTAAGIATPSVVPVAVPASAGRGIR